MYDDNRMYVCTRWMILRYVYFAMYVCMCKWMCICTKWMIYTSVSDVQMYVVKCVWYSTNECMYVTMDVCMMLYNMCEVDVAMDVCMT